MTSARICFTLSSVLLILPTLASAQVLLDPEKYPAPVALFDSPGNSGAIGCEVRPMRLQLNYGFHLVSGYVGRLSLKHYEGSGHRFAVVIRVTPDDTRRQPTYLSQLFELPTIPKKSSAQIEMDGAFFVGEGGYQVDWLIADRAGQTCRKHWHIDAKPPRGDRELDVSLPPGTVAPLRYERWKGVNLDTAEPLRLALYIHVAPLSMRRLKIHPYDQTMLLSSVLSLLERTAFTSIKVVAFNLDQQKEIFRQDEFTPRGWERLIDAVSGLDLATVPVSVLAKRTGPVDQIRRYFNQELSASQPADAVVFLGPSTRSNEKLRFEAPEHGPRFYYFEYKPFWARGSEFPDVISHAIHALSGKTFHIYSPHDFSMALRFLMNTTKPGHREIQKSSRQLTPTPASLPSNPH